MFQADSAEAIREAPSHLEGVRNRWKAANAKREIFPAAFNASLSCCSTQLEKERPSSSAACLALLKSSSERLIEVAVFPSARRPWRFFFSGCFLAGIGQSILHHNKIKYFSCNIFPRE